MPFLEQSAVTINWIDCPLVEINPLKLSGTPILKGTRMPADAILSNYSEGCSAEEIASIFDLPEAGVRALLSWTLEQNPAFAR